MKIQASVLRNLFMVSCLCISRVTNVFGEDRDTLGTEDFTFKVSFKSFERFKIARRSSSKHIPQRSQSLWHISRARQQKKRKTTRKKEHQKARKVKKHTTPCQKRNVVGSKPDLRMKPPQGEELVFRRKRSFIGTEVSPGSTEPPRSRRIS